MSTAVKHGSGGGEGLSGHIVAELAVQEAAVSSTTPAQQVSDFFEVHPDAPGVLIVDDGRLTGMLSRVQVLQQLSRPFGQELFLRRPVRDMLEVVPTQLLVIPGDIPIHEAAAAALNRDKEHVYDPIVVIDPKTDRPGLLDIHVLLKEQTRLLEVANHAVQEQKTIAVAASEAKSRFLANMSHEIRTPLTAIIGFAENLSDPSYAPNEREVAAETVLRNARHLLDVINDILDLSKIEAGKLETEAIPTVIAELTEGVVRLMRVRAEQKGLRLQLSLDEGLPMAVMTDPTRLRQILMNLIGNAIKFTESGMVGIHVGSFCSGTMHRLQFDITDTGIGLSEEQLGRLFQPFTQADGSTSRRFGGTGLGLSISRRLAEMLGGGVTVDSIPGEGSTFHVTIQAEQSAVPADQLIDSVIQKTTPEIVHGRPSSGSSAAEPCPCRILLAEDGRDNQLLIGSFLRKTGAVVEIAENGEEARDLAMTAAKSGAAFDVVLMDMQMPRLDGYAAARELRQAGYSGAIIALTANAMQGDREKCLDAGCDDYATKPIDRNQLLQQIRQLLPLEGRQTDCCCRESDSSTVQDDLTLPEAGDDCMAVPQGGCDSAPAVAADTAKEDPRVLVTNFVVVDRHLAMERSGGDADLLSMMGELFCEECPERTAEILAIDQASDAVEVRRLFHSLKTTCDNLGLAVLRDQFRELENRVHESGVPIDPGLWERLAADLEQAAEAVRVEFIIG